MDTEKLTEDQKFTIVSEAYVTAVKELGKEKKVWFPDQGVTLLASRDFNLTKDGAVNHRGWQVKCATTYVEWVYSARDIADLSLVDIFKKYIYLPKRVVIGGLPDKNKTLRLRLDGDTDYKFKNKYWMWEIGRYFGNGKVYNLILLYKNSSSTVYLCHNNLSEYNVLRNIMVLNNTVEELITP